MSDEDQAKRRIIDRKISSEGERKNKKAAELELELERERRK